MPNEIKQNKLAVLIDADNAQPSIIEELLAEIAKYGTANIKRIFGDWTNQNSNGWKKALLNHAIEPIQQFAYTTGKNATDSAMIINAMDLLHSNQLDGFCIVSSDSDFTRLAMRIRESGLFVYGFGQQKTPKAFTVACDKFIFTENLQKDDEDEEKEMCKYSTNELKMDTKLVNLLRKAVEASANDNGWASLGQVGNYINNQFPEFDSRNYGFSKLSEIVKHLKLFEIDAGTNKSALYIKDKRKK